MISVILAEDHHLVRQGIRALLEKTEDIQVIEEAGDGQEAVELTALLKPDVLLMDIAMPRMNGIQATERICVQCPGTQVVILSMYSDDSLVSQALQSGARGYLLKRSITDELLIAVRAAHRGEIFLSPAISKTILEDFLTQQAVSGESTPIDRLTPRQRQVMQLIAEGNTNAAIAQNLGVSIKTIEKHRTNLMDKLDVHDLAALVRLAVKHKLIFLDE